MALYFGSIHPILGFAVPILSGALVGLIITVMTVKWRFPAWVATISMQFLLQGVTLMITRGNTYKPAQPIAALSAFGNFSWGYVTSYPVSYTHLDVYKRQAHARAVERPERVGIVFHISGLGRNGTVSAPGDAQLTAG